MGLVALRPLLAQQVFTRAAYGPKLLSFPFFLSESAAIAIAIAAVSAIQPPCPEPAGAVTDENGARPVQKNPRRRNPLLSGPRAPPYPNPRPMYVSACDSLLLLT
jgi:hypothetical protein